MSRDRQGGMYNMFRAKGSISCGSLVEGLLWVKGTFYGLPLLDETSFPGLCE